MTKSSPTVRQLAELAGVSRTTVSLALRNHPSISLPTRERIRELADARGYVLDPLYARLMGQLRVRRADRPPEKLAFLTTWNTRDEWHQKSYNDRNYYTGVVRRAAKLGYEVEVFWAKEPGMTARRLGRILHTRSIRGLVILPLSRPYGHFTLAWQHFASVTFGHTLFKPDLHRVTHFHSKGMVLALRCLRHQGYRRIGYANILAEDARSHHGWLAAYLAYQHTHEPSHRVPPFLPRIWKKDAFAKWLKTYRVDAVVGNLPMVLGCPAELGMRPGEDLGVASLDVQFEGDFPTYAGVDQQPQVQGATAVDILVSDLQRNEFGLPTFPRFTQLGGVWVNGPTTRGRTRTEVVSAAH